MTLTFENSFGKERKIASVSDEKEAFTEIHKFLKDHNYKSYYTRSWLVDSDHKVFDVGSHTEFFHLYND